MAKAPLFSFALVFAAGFMFGFMYHHIASMAHEAIVSESGDSMLPRLRSVEARLAALEAARAAGGLPALVAPMADATVVAATTHQRLTSAASALASHEHHEAHPQAKKKSSLWFFVPAGVKSGEEVTVDTPTGPMTVTVPAGKVEGDKFEVVQDDGGSKMVEASSKHSRKHHSSSSGSAGKGAGAARDTSGCPAGRKPYHIVLTAQDNLYQQWQTRIMFHHFQKLQKADPCTEMTGFTRLLSSPDGGRDIMSDEIPTVHAKMLSPGGACRHTEANTCDMGFPVMNRPHAVTQFLAQIPASITEEYVLIAETDHLFLKEVKNRATPSKPMCFPFGYMNSKAPELRPIVAKWADDPDVVDPCGPSPILIHLPQLRKLTPEWLDLSFKLKRDPEADKIFGWVLEMWGYTIAASRLGIRHLVWSEFQTEPSSLWHSSLDGNPHIYHYTFGLEYTLDGLAVTGVGDWSLDKRHFMSEYPPKALAAPPKCAGKAAATLTAMFNEASAAIPQWPERTSQRGVLGWGGGAASPGKAGVHAITEEAYHRSALAKAIVARGAWQWEGKAPIVFFRGGRVSTPWGTGTWGLAGDAIGVSLGGCGSWRLVFSKNARSFTATLGHDASGSTYGALAAPHANDANLPAEPERAEGWLAHHDEADITLRLVGSGPWAWTGVAPFAFLPHGRLFTPWGRGTWWPHESLESAIHCNFVGQKHIVTFDECWSFTSVRVSDSDRATGSAKIDPPPKTCPELTGGGDVE